MNMDIETELCLKCESINIDRIETVSSTNNNNNNNNNNKNSSQISNENNRENNVKTRFKNFGKMNLLSDLPVNIQDIKETDNSIILNQKAEAVNNKTLLTKHNRSSLNLLASTTVSVFSQMTNNLNKIQSSSSTSSNNTKTKTIRRTKAAKTNLLLTPQINGSGKQETLLGTIGTPTTARKRLNQNLKNIENENDHANTTTITTTPKAKRRLIDSTCTTNMTTADHHPLTINTTAIMNNNRTILHYFSPKPPQTSL
jgi:hypothetical protein